MKINAKNLLKCLDQIVGQYPDIIVHSLSVGAYLWAEMLVTLTTERKNDKIVSLLHENIKGAIFDSIVFEDDCAPGLSRAVTTTPIIQPMLEAIISGYLSYGWAVKHYKAAAPLFNSNYMPCPRMIFSSKVDLVSSAIKNR